MASLSIIQFQYTTDESYVAVSLQRKDLPQGLPTLNARQQQQGAEKLSPLDDLKGDIVSSSNWTLGCNFFLPQNPFRVCSEMYFDHNISGLIMEDSFPKLPLRYAILKESWEKMLLIWVICCIPCTATLSTGKPSSCAMNPMMPKMTKPAKKLVRQLPMDTTNASLLWGEREIMKVTNIKINMMLVASVTLKVKRLAIPVAVIVKLVVGWKCYEATPAWRQAEEDLDGSITPHLRTKWDTDISDSCQ